MNHGLKFPDIGATFEVERLRRDRNELIGELTVRCLLPGASVVNGILSTGDFNFSSVRARQDRAKLLAVRAHTNGDVDWFAMLEEFCQGVFVRERTGDPSCDIWSLPLPEKVDDFAVDGIALPRKHPAILFGDGGSAKSYVALYIAGRLALQDVPVALFDWELSGEEHRDRFERLFGAKRPKLTYCRCESPLVSEIDRLARVVWENGIQYAFFDSISFACDGRPEEAEIAARYFRAVRTLNIGTLHIAHVNKSEEHDRKPFGSSWWHNGARCTWYVKAAEPAGDTMDLGFFHRKSNLGALRHPISLSIQFLRNETIIRRGKVGDTPEFVDKMSVRQRMVELLGRGAMTIAEIAAELEVKVDTIKKTSVRGTTFVEISNAMDGEKRIGLRARAV